MYLPPDEELEQDLGFVNNRPRHNSFSGAMDRLSENLNRAMETFQNEIKKTLATELQNIQAVIHEVKGELAEVKSSNNELKTSITTLSSKQLEITAQITTISFQVSKYGERLTTLENNGEKSVEIISQVQDLSSTVQSLREQIAVRDQRDRLKNLEISGVPQTKGENLLNILNSLCVKIGMSLSPYDLDDIHRVRRFVTVESKETTQVPNIIIHFGNKRKRNDFLAACKSRRNINTVDLGLDGPARQVFINEHLTPQNKRLLKQVRDIGKDLDYKYIWVKDGKIFLRKGDTSRIILISNERDLSKIK